MNVLDKIRKISIYFTITTAGFFFLVKRFSHKKRNKVERNTLKELRYLFSKINIDKIDKLTLLCKIHAEDPTSIINKQIKLNKIENCINDILKKQIPALSSQASEGEREEVKEDNISLKRVNKSDNVNKGDQLFYSLFQNISKMYIKDNKQQIN